MLLSDVHILTYHIIFYRKDGPSSMERWPVSENLFDFDYIVMPVISIGKYVCPGAYVVRCTL
jgi:hypothetical protein